MNSIRDLRGRYANRDDAASESDVNDGINFVSRINLPPLVSPTIQHFFLKRKDKAEISLSKTDRFRLRRAIRFAMETREWHLDA